jgi:recombination protein RecA
MTITPALKGVMREINKKEPGSIMLASEIESASIPTITSGSLNLDAALGGGWATNHWIEIVGRPSAGKTALIMKTIAENQKLDPNWVCAWFATEDFVEDYATMWGCDLSRILVHEENIMELVFDAVLKMLATRDVDCIVIDSYPAMETMAEHKGDITDQQRADGAKLMGKFLRKANGDLKRPLTAEGRQCTCFIINQWRSKMTLYGDPRTTPGGEGKDYHFFQRVEVRRDDWITNSKEDTVGQVLKIENMKNKLSRPKRTAYIDAYIAKGNGFGPGDYDVVKDVVSAAIAYEVIQKDKAHYNFAGQQWYGRPALDTAVKEDTKLQAQIRRAVFAAAAPPKKKVTRA